MTASPVVLYVRDGCHLCDIARPVVAAVCAAAGAQWTEVDVDATGDPRAADLSELVPVVYVGTTRVAFWRVDAQELAVALADAGFPTDRLNQ